MANTKAMVGLFGVEVPAISKHLSNIFSEGELQLDATISKMEIVQQEGNRNVKRLVDFYNLDAIISVGYRVNSRKATQLIRASERRIGLQTWKNAPEGRILKSDVVIAKLI